MATQQQEPVLFVSHHSSKVETAEHVERALKAKGVRCWIAPRDVDPGEPFDRAVRKAIAETDAMLLLFCSKSEKSRHVKRELILADQLGKAIIPLRLERIDPGELSYHLADSQWIDWLEQRDGVIDRIAAKARDFQAGDPFEPSPPVIDRAPPAPEPRDIDPAAPLSFDKPAVFRPQPEPQPEPDRPAPAPPRVDHQPLSAAAGAPLPGGPAAFPPADAGSPPDRSSPHPEPGRPGGGRKWIWIGLGALLLAALIGAALWYFLLRNPPISEDWFAGRWGETDECEAFYTFEDNGDVIAPDQSRGTWSIERGNELVIEWDDETERRVIRRVSANEISSSEGPAYRCD